MLTIYRIKGGKSWSVMFNGQRITAYATKKEAKAFISEMQHKYSAMLGGA